MFPLLAIVKVELTYKHFFLSLHRLSLMPLVLSERSEQLPVVFDVFL
jgi:hypothetical protein